MYIAPFITLLHELACEYQENVPMRYHTTFQIGGPARLFVTPNTTTQINRILNAAKEYNLDLHIIGKGSNILVPDEGLSGVVLHLSSSFSQINLIDSQTIVCESGCTLDKLCKFALEHSLSGLEFAYGIPGSVGGAVYMNAGAYNGEIKDVILCASYISSNGLDETLQKSDMDFSYRHSIFSETDSCITSATFHLQKGQYDEILSCMKSYKAKRMEKQPLDFPSAGSTFKRPKGGYASALIDSCGLKGLRAGGAMVSTKHAGFIINYDHATCQDVLHLIKEVQTIVYQKTGFQLECEVRCIQNTPDLS